MTSNTDPQTPGVAPARTADCAALPPTAAAAQMQDGTWEASWEEPGGRDGARRGRRSGFETREAALAHARRVETALRLNRC